MCGIVKVCVHTYLLIYLLFWKISQQQQAVCHTSTFFWSMGIQWGFVLFAQEQAARYSLSKSLSQKFFWSIVKKLWTFAMLLLIRKVYYCGFYMYSMCTIYKALVTPHTATNYDLKSCFISKKKKKKWFGEGFLLEASVEAKMHEFKFSLTLIWLHILKSNLVPVCSVSGIESGQILTANFLLIYQWSFL